MNRLKVAALALALLAVPAASFAEAREVTPGLLQGKGDIEVIYEFRNIAITTTNNCLAFSAKTDDACDNLALNQINVPRAFLLTNIRLSVDVAGNAASTCDLFVEIGATSAGNEMTAFSVVTLGAVIDEPQKLIVNKADLLAVNISDDSGCYDTTAPTVSVWLEGQYL